VKSLMDESSRLLDELWDKTMGVFDWSDQICQLRTCFGCEATSRHIACSKDGQVIPSL
jgi:hypothetical protein